MNLTQANNHDYTAPRTINGNPNFTQLEDQFQSAEDNARDLKLVQLIKAHKIIYTNSNSRNSKILASTKQAWALISTEMGVSGKSY